MRGGGLFFNLLRWLDRDFLSRVGAMKTEVYATSLDDIEIDGEIKGSVKFTDEYAVLIFSDGTILKAVIELDISCEFKIIERGTLLDIIEKNVSECDGFYSDVVTFKQGVKWCYGSSDFEKVS